MLPRCFRVGNCEEGVLPFSSLPSILQDMPSRAPKYQKRKQMKSLRLFKDFQCRDSGAVHAMNI
jgi:hypothetical protein